MTERQKEKVVGAGCSGVIALLICMILIPMIRSSVRAQWHSVPSVATSGSYEVDAVFLREAGHYTVLLDSHGVLNAYGVGSYTEECSVVTDAPIGKRCFVSWVHRTDTTPWYAPSDERSWAVIHVHSADDLQGGEWRSGKGMHGPIVRVQ